MLFSFILIDCASLVPELQGSIEEVAKEKCKTAFKLLNQPVITEDTCLIFDAFGHDSLPGPYIKWFLKSLGPEGIPKIPFVL